MRPKCTGGSAPSRSSSSWLRRLSAISRACLNGSNGESSAGSVTVLLRTSPERAEILGLLQCLIVHGRSAGKQLASSISDLHGRTIAVAEVRPL